MNRPKSLIDQSRFSLKCLLAGDSGCIFARMSEPEISGCGYTRKSVDSIMKSYVTPVIQRLRVDGKMESQLLTWQGVASLKFKDENGNPIDLMMISMSDGERPRIIFSKILTWAAISKGAIRRKSSPKPSEQFEDLADELEKIYPELKRLGVHSMFDVIPVEGDQQVTSIPTYIANIRKNLPNIRGLEAKSSTQLPQ